MSGPPTRTRPAARPPAPVGGAQQFAARRRQLRRRRLGRLAVAAGVLALVGALAWVVLASPLLAVRTVVVAGNARATAGLVELTADVPTGRPLARVDVAAAEQRVEALPVVADATVVRDWPHTVRVVVTERSARAVARGGTGSGWRLVDAEGVDFAGVAERPAGLPLLDLDLAAADPSRVRAAMAVVAALPATVARSVTTVRAGSPDDVTLVLRGGAVIRWGSAERAADKVAVLRALLTRKAAVYDVRAPDAPTTRR